MATYLPAWGAHTERQIGDGPFLAGSKLHVADIKLYMAVNWFIGGKVDYVPATIFANFGKLVRVHQAVRDHERVKAWYTKG